MGLATTMRLSAADDASVYEKWDELAEHVLRGRRAHVETWWPRCGEER